MKQNEGRMIRACLALWLMLWHLATLDSGFEASGSGLMAKEFELSHLCGV